MNMQQAIKHLKAFTIVELVVVIAVIGILASIVIVSYTKTRNQADQSSYNATAQQVKMKLGEYYTDNNAYPTAKAALLTYLDSTGASSLKDDFSAAAYSYNAYKSSAKATCSGADCQYYEITVTKDNWDGDSTDTDLVVKP